MNFEFATATRILFGPGMLKQVGALAAELGNRALVAAGSPSGASVDERVAPLLKNLAAAQIDTVLLPVHSEPTVESVRQGTDLVMREHCNLVISYGGGSALDTGKAIAALMTNHGDILDYLEVVGKGKPITQPGAPFVAIPTTAGTGAEVTRNAVLGIPEQRIKVSLRSLLMLPRLALVDPELTYSLPPQVTASTGLDAFTQLIEPYVSNRSNPLTDTICREGIRRAARSLLRAYQEGQDPAAREDMALASLFGGLALANSKLGAVHGFAAPLGGMFPAPHGAVCARLLPYVIEVNVRALQERKPGSEALRRYTEIGRLLTGRPDASAEDAVAWVQEICTALQTPPLASYGLTPLDFPDLIAEAARASSMQGNPIELTSQELDEILSCAL